MKTGGERDESGAMGRAAVRYCPLRCTLIPLPIPAAVEPEGSQGHTGGGGGSSWTRGVVVTAMNK